MDLKGIKIGFGLTGSFYLLEKAIVQIKGLVEKGAIIIPIMSQSVYTLDTKFGNAKKIISEVEEITGKKIIHTLKGAEPIGSRHLTDIMIIAPCSGNTLAKLSNGITDGPILMAARANFRNNKPLVIGISTNDGLSRKC